MSRRIAVLAAVAALLAACADDKNVEPSPSVTFATATPTTPTSTDTPSTDTESTETTVAGSTTPATDPVATISLVEGAVVFSEFAGGFNKPVDLAWRADDPTLYIVQQDGYIVPLRDGQLGAPVLDLHNDVSTGNEQGLLGLAFHPTAALAYVNYTDNGGDTVVAEYAVGADGSFDAASARVVITIDQPYANHNGGDLAFGPDGYLYIGMGDGGAGGDPERRALNVTQLLGKILRIDPAAAGAAPYTVPADNPFVGVAGARPEIWSVGVRNPWRFNFDSATGDLWIADVGQNAWEEVDVARAAEGGGRGLNFGWSAMEGNHPFNDDQSPDGATPPVHEYEHGDDGCSISGGTVYRGSAVASLMSWYVFGDYCSGKVWALQAGGGGSTLVQLGTQGSVSAICAGPDGELYILEHGGGTIYRIDPA